MGHVPPNAINAIAMFRNFLKTALRSLLRKKSVSFLNLAGLVTGIACASLIFLWVEDEKTFNDNFPNHDRIYRILENQTYDGKTSTFNATPGLMAATIAREFPEISRAARSGGDDRQLFSFGDKSLNFAGEWVDSAFPGMLDLPKLAGVVKFDGKQSLLIDESMAKSFFGSASAVGRPLRLNSEQDYIVAGVFKDLPGNSTFVFHWLAPIENIDHKQPWMPGWNANWARTYVELKPGTDVAAVNRRLKNYLAAKNGGNKTQCFLFAMNDWNLRWSFTDGKPDGNGRIRYVNLFSAIAWIILLIACINFMNLSTARSEQRAREVGVRKVLGAGRSKLIAQFLVESVLTTSLSVLLAVGMIMILLPGFNAIVGKTMLLHIDAPVHLFYLAAIALVTGLVAGSYPAFFLSGFRPTAVFRGMQRGNFGPVFIRRALVVLQFSISIVLIIGTAVVYRQVRHVKDRNLGYTRDNLLYVEVQGNLDRQFSKVRHDLIGTGLVRQAALSDNTVLEIGSNSDGYQWKGKDPSQNPLISWENVSSGFLATMSLSLVEGRDFYPGENSDTNSVIINQAFAAKMGGAGHIGTVISAQNGRNYTVSGIVRNFLFNDMYASTEPLALYQQSAGTHVLSMRLTTGHPLQTSLEKISSTLRADNPGYPVDLKFVDSDFDARFKTETLTGRLAGLFATLAILISCLGLFGLAAHMAERRRREIGIRKVLGSSIVGLAGLLSKEFLGLVALAAIIAFPVAYRLMANWLNGFAYRTTIPWWLFAGAAVLAVLIALTTISSQVVRAALTSPVKSLKSE